MSDFEVMPAGSSKALQQALQQLERGFAGGHRTERHPGTVIDPRPVAWRFRIAGVEHAAWRLTDDAGLVEQMRKLGHWDIRPLGELPVEGGA
jgi:hypothetical protein